jgi:PIN domain nuclease of toxin-antitoxin system
MCWARFDQSSLRLTTRTGQEAYLAESSANLGNNIPCLSVRISHIEMLSTLAVLHKDPFDRILVAQALAENLPLVTKDPQLRLYGISIIW